MKLLDVVSQSGRAESVQLPAARRLVETLNLGEFLANWTQKRHDDPITVSGSVGQE